MEAAEQPPPADAAAAAAAAMPPEPVEHWSAPDGMENSLFLGSITEDGLREEAAVVASDSVVKRKRGRPPKNPGAPRAPPPVRRKEEDEEVVCFICFDGGNLVVCDRRGCPKVYHPACINRDESFFRSRGKWNCGWHICSICERAAHFMCYTCTYSLCKGCTRDAKFFCVRGSKGFCDTCFSTILLIEAKEDEMEKKAGLDFDDKDNWEYLFKLYWLDQKRRLPLTLEELSNAKNPWKGTVASRIEEESSDELYDASNDMDVSSDGSSGHRKRNSSSRRKARKQSKKHADDGSSDKKCESLTLDIQSSPKKVENKGKSIPEDTEWASPELLELVGHMKDGDKSFITQFDVQALLLEYIKRYNLRDPRKKSQIICDSRLHKLFGKPRVGHFEMLKLLELHFLVKEASQVTCDDNQGSVLESDLGQLDDEGYGGTRTRLDRGRKIRKKSEREPQTNLDDYAAIDVHNISLVYLRRCLMEDLVDDIDTFAEKVVGAFVRIRIPGIGQRQDLYRLVQIVGMNRVTEGYKIGKKTTDIALEILNLDKKEVITIDAISNQEFTEEECKRLRQSIKCGLITRLKVGDIQEKTRILQSIRVSEWLENEKLRLSHLRDRASETGRRKELRECVEKLQLLSTPEERIRRLKEVPLVHADPHMDPDYESAEEEKEAASNNKAAGNYGIGRSWDSSSHTKKRKPLPSGRAGLIPNLDLNGVQKGMNNSCFSSRSPSMEGVGNTDHRKELLRTQETDLHWTNGWDTPRSCDVAPKDSALPSPRVSVLTNVMETDKVWHYVDPSGIIQGPFPLVQLAKWTSYFPPDLRVWLTFERQENSLLLTDVLSQYQKDAGVKSSTGNACQFDWTGDNNSTWFDSAYNTNTRNACQNNAAFSPVDTLHPQEGRLDTTLRGWEPSKDANRLGDQVQGHTGYALRAPFPRSSYGPPAHHAGGFHQGKWNNDQALGNMQIQNKSPSCSSSIQQYRYNARDSDSQWNCDGSGGRSSFQGSLSPCAPSKTEPVALLGSVPSVGSSVNPVEALSLNLASNALKQSESTRASGSWPDPSLPHSNAVNIEQTINQQESNDVAPDPSTNPSSRQLTSVHIVAAVYSPVRDNNQHLKSTNHSPTPQCEREQEPSVIEPKELGLRDCDSALVARASVLPNLPADPLRESDGLELPSSAVCEGLPDKDSVPVDGKSEAADPGLTTMSKAESADKSSDPQEPSDDQVCAPASPLKVEIDGFSTSILSPWREPRFFQPAPWKDGFSLPSPTPVSYPSGWEGDSNSNPDEKMNLIDSKSSAGLNRGTENVSTDDGMSSNISTSWGLPEQLNTNMKHGWGTPFLSETKQNAGWAASMHGTTGAGRGVSIQPNGHFDLASGKQQMPDTSAGWGLGLGNANRSWNSLAGNPDLGTRWKHGDDRHHHLGGNRSGNKADGGGRGGPVRLPFRGKGQRGICKFHESGYCKKGASCNYLHP